MHTNATPAQREAITADHPDLLVLAGPGSGKTKTTIDRISYILSIGGKPEEMAALTFTNAGAHELGRRLPLKPDQSGQIDLGFTGTLHAFCLRMLKEHGEKLGFGPKIAVISPESAVDLLESKARSIGCKTPTDRLLELKRAGRPARGAKFDLAATVVATYFDDLKESGIVDYDTLLTEMRDALRGDSAAAHEFRTIIARKFTYLFVDEVQDSAPLDWEIYLLLPIAFKFYVGDTDQAIYAFRGGRMAETLDHARSTSTRVIKLEENFRSRCEICDAANALISRNQMRIEKRTVSAIGPGGSIEVIPVINEGEEIGAVARKIQALLAHDKPSIAVLAFTNAIADGFRRTLTATGVPIVSVEKSKLPHDWNLARSFVELLSNPSNDTLAFFYLIALYEKKGARPREAREAAHAVRKAAASVGRTINEANLHFSPLTDPSDAIRALAAEPVSAESKRVVIDRFKKMPRGATLAEFSLSLAELREFEKEGEGEGVVVSTIHGAKGREFDVVFLAGAEDELLPGRAAKVSEEAVEEMRRVFFVAITRAKRDLIISHAASRVMTYGNFKETLPRTPSRFIAELSSSWPAARIEAKAK